MVVVGLADSMANAAGIRVSQETVVHSTKTQIFRSMVLAFMGTFIATVALTLPLIFLELSSAVFVSTLVGMLFLGGLGVFVSIRRLYNKREMVILIGEYILTGIVIVTISYLLGSYFKNPWVVLWLQSLLKKERGG